MFSKSVKSSEDSVFGCKKKKTRILYFGSSNFVTSAHNPEGSAAAYTDATRHPPVAHRVFRNALFMIASCFWGNQLKIILLKNFEINCVFKKIKAMPLVSVVCLFSYKLRPAISRAITVSRSGAPRERERPLSAFCWFLHSPPGKADLPRERSLWGSLRLNFPSCLSSRLRVVSVAKINRLNSIELARIKV